MNLLKKPEPQPTTSNIKWLFTDVDGVLTDGGVYYSAQGEELKKFNLRDGMGAERLRAMTGIQIGFLTGENSEIVTRRAEKLKIEKVFLGIKNKDFVMTKFLEEQNLSYENLAYIGDDMNDFEVMQNAGMTACPADSADEIIRISKYVCKKNGGAGAFREFCEYLISKYS
jgi:3-deoxy-D-manno-octulosonate 8-phosphate phosphatase (KDO 8-P phosphatase)